MDTLNSLHKIKQSGWDKNLLANEFVWKVKDGRSVRFWEDVWYGVSPLQKVFPRLYNIYGMKTASLRLIWEVWIGWGGLPDLIWTRNLRAWEAEQVSVLNQILASLVLTEGEDVLF